MHIPSSAYGKTQQRYEAVSRVSVRFALRAVLATIVSSRAVDIGSVVSSDNPVNAVHASQLRPPHSEDVAISGLPRLFELLSKYLA